MSLCIFVIISACGLLWLVSHGSVLVALPACLVFSFLMLTNYALLHEAAHNNLHSTPRINWALGILCACLFPVAFTFYQKAHIFHHQNNRSEHERFEYYHPADSLAYKILRHLQWYSIILGTYWLFIPLFSLICSTIPWLLRAWPLNTFITTKKLFSGLDLGALQKVSLETLIMLFFWISIWNILELKSTQVILMYMLFAFNWSTRQYIAHAFTPLDRDTGALNLTTNPVMERIMLYSNWHLLHHQNPDLPWHLIPAFTKNQPAMDYWKQYRRLWSAPKPLPLAKDNITMNSIST